MAGNFSNLRKETDIQVQESQRVPSRPTPRHGIIKMAKVKDREFLRHQENNPKSHIQGNLHKAVS